MELQSVKNRFGIIGRSPQLDNALATAIRVAPTDLTVLITGESGVGKEVFSKIIHSLSPRKHNSFIAVNCGAIPEGTINSELFGHVKGSFTGATSDRKGYFETVDGGTIFLDEIGDLPLDTQAFLLRVLESGEFMRVGSSNVHKTDVRVIAATNFDLHDKIKQGKFREDLFYRLNTVPIKVPPLRQRKEDIHLLFRKFASDFAERYSAKTVRLTEDARILIDNYSWPGNIRELKNLAEQLSVLSENEMVDAKALLQIAPQMREKQNLPALTDKAGNQFEERELLYKVLFEMKSDLNDLKGLVFELMRSNNLELSDYASLRKVKSNFGESNIMPYLKKEYGKEHPIEYSDHGPEYYEDSGPILINPKKENGISEEQVPEEISLSLEEMERKLIEKALEKHHGKRRDAADELGISERTLYRKIKQYDL
jgi:transcriptional regulator with PAS, ATPase and Fis domain